MIPDCYGSTAKLMLLFLGVKVRPDAVQSCLNGLQHKRQSSIKATVQRNQPMREHLNDHHLHHSHINGQSPYLRDTARGTYVEIRTQRTNQIDDQFMTSIFCAQIDYTLLKYNLQGLDRAIKPGGVCMTPLLRTCLVCFLRKIST